MELVCLRCGKELGPRRRAWCSDRCREAEKRARARDRKPPEPRPTCERCSAPVPPGSSKFCSIQCRRDHYNETDERFYSPGRHVLRTYGITNEEYGMILNSQAGKCGVCGNRPRSVRLAVDHDHKTGMVRGLLCSFCNRALGTFRDSAELLRKAVEYLENPPAVQVVGERIVPDNAKTARRARGRSRF